MLCVLGGLPACSSRSKSFPPSENHDKRDLVEVFEIQNEQKENYQEVAVKDGEEDPEERPSEPQEQETGKSAGKKEKPPKKKSKGSSQAPGTGEEKGHSPARTGKEDSNRPARELSVAAAAESLETAPVTMVPGPTQIPVSYPETSDYPELFKNYDKVSAKVWEQFQPKIFPGETLKYHIKYFGVVCGDVILKTYPITQIGKKKTYHLYAQMKSAPFYKYVYTLDDFIETYLEVGSFLPVKYTLVQRESSQVVDDLQLFDMEKMKTYFWFYRNKKGEVKKMKETSYLPYWVQDSFSALFFVRGLPLKHGDVYEIPVVTRAKVWILKVSVLDREELFLDTFKKKVKAIRLKAETHYPGVLKKRGDILFWYSDDDRHKLLKFSAKVKIGTIDGELFEESL